MGLGPRVIDWVVVSYGGDEEARYCMWRFALQARAVDRWFTFFAPKVQRTIRMTCGPGPPCHRLGRLGVWCASVGISCSISRASGRVCLEEGFTPRAAVTLSHSLPISAPFRIHTLLLCAAVVAMASLVHPERF